MLFLRIGPVENRAHTEFNERLEILADRQEYGKAVELMDEYRSQSRDPFNGQRLKFTRGVKTARMIMQGRSRVPPYYSSEWKRKHKKWRKVAEKNPSLSLQFESYGFNSLVWEKVPFNIT